MEINSILKIFSTNPHWIIPILVGLLLGALSRELIPRIKNIIFSKVQNDPVKGIWYSAHLTYDIKGVLIVRHEKWEFIPNRWRGKLQLNVYGHKKQLTFEGLVDSTEENYRFTVKGSHKEIAFHRIQKVFQDQLETYGLWLGIDYRGKMISAARLLSRTEISETVFDEWIANCYQQHSNLSNNLFWRII